MIYTLPQRPQIVRGPCKLHHCTCSSPACSQCPIKEHLQAQRQLLGLDGAAGVPVKTVVADSVWQALATGNFTAVALSFGKKLSDKVKPAARFALFVLSSSGLYKLAIDEVLQLFLYSCWHASDWLDYPTVNTALMTIAHMCSCCKSDGGIRPC